MVNGEDISTNIPAASIPVWTVDLGAEYKVTHVEIITAESSVNFVPRDISMSDSAGTTFVSAGTFGAAETVAAIVQNEFATPTVGN